MKHPDRKQCMKYLEEYGTPERVIGHCKAVAAVAYALGKALNEAGGTKAPAFNNVHFISKATSSGRTRYIQDNSRTEIHGNSFRKFDMELVLAAGLLHDMARVEDNHWDVCADFCRNLSLFEEEKIVRIHMQYEYSNDANHLTEADLVSLGDRLSLEDRYAGLDRRMDYIIAKAERHGKKDARKKIMEKKAETQELLREIENRTGITIDKLMENLDYENIEKRMI